MPTAVETHTHGAAEKNEKTEVTRKPLPDANTYFHLNQPFDPVWVHLENAAPAAADFSKVLAGINAMGHTELTSVRFVGEGNEVLGIIDGIVLAPPAKAAEAGEDAHASKKK